MAQQIQQLIDKIKEEGILAAEHEASQIQKNAQQKAQKIIEEARNNAEKMIADAREEIDKMQQSSQLALHQAARDMLLTLRKEIETKLNSLISQQVQDTLTPEHMLALIQGIVEKVGQPGETVLLDLSEREAEDFKNSMVAKLQQELKREIVVQSADDIHKGFTISFDRGRSSFDFSDESLAEYLGAFLNTAMEKILKESIRQ